MRMLILAGAILFSATGFAQDYAIVGGTVHTLGDDGKIENATVIIRDGRITAVGAGLAVPGDVERIDAKGKEITPGIFDPLSYLGLVEVSLEDSSNDTSAPGRLSAGFDVAAAINPRSTLVPVNRIEGVTRALVAPRAGEGGHVIAGQAALFHLGNREPRVSQGRAMVAYLGEAGARLAGGSRAAALTQLEEALEDAADFIANRDSYDVNARRSYSVGRLDLEALGSVVGGRTPLLVYAQRASDIEAVLRLKKAFNLKVIIAGAAEGWMVARELAAAGVPVILEPTANLPSRFESLNASLENPARLERAGVTIAFSESESHNARNVTQSAGNAVANGLPWEAALRAITVNPARLYSMDDVGTLEPGMIADLVVWDGDPLEVTSFADAVFIAGERVSMQSRQTLLRDRYFDLGDERPPAYRR